MTTTTTTEKKKRTRAVPRTVAGARTIVGAGQKTHATKAGEISRQWRVVDADGATLGRLSTRVATLLRGKHKATFTPHLDTGDPVVIVNAAKIRVTGKKLTDKFYSRHSGYPGGYRAESLEDLLKRRPTEVVRHSVRGMLPRNRLGEQMMRKLFIYAGPEHPHKAQRPEAIEEAKKA
ncbi:MAG TPA: 50S ribosomal protein L13 [Candidatus Limnocylindria bacterium]|nr:50S ribosomal protein L13 [Candidatus Limnocylindria bacterium]